eukprot:COSAG02_NODE_274_length_26244_cov_36.943507_21_plen_100_part_00
MPTTPTLLACLTRPSDVQNLVRCVPDTGFGSDHQLAHPRVQDAVAAIIGFWGGIAGQITGVLLSISSDFLGGRKRAMLIGLSGLSVVLIGNSPDNNPLG